MGLTIEMVTSISLILSVGLALDYAAHFGVIFSCLKTGTREEKMRKSLEEIGSAVLNGGFSTFLAFFLLAFSDAYAFNTFFKVSFPKVHLLPQKFIYKGSFQNSLCSLF